MIEAMITPILTKPDLLYRMIDSIDHDIEHLVIIDNGQCVDRELLDTRWQHHIKRMSLISMPANLGVAGSWNLGIKAAPFASSWLICNFDITWPAGSLRMFDEQQDNDVLLLSAGSPRWCAFMLGDRVVANVGLFDESLHPAYFEDNDYEQRVSNHMHLVMHSDIAVHHENSSTLAAGYQEKNNRTFSANRDYYMSKGFFGDERDHGSFSLTRRRRLSWD